MLGAQERIAARLETADLFTLLAPRRFVKGSPGRWPLGDAHVFSYKRARTATISLCFIISCESYRNSVFRSYSSEHISSALWKTHRALRTLSVEYQIRPDTESLKLLSDLAWLC